MSRTVLICLGSLEDEFGKKNETGMWKNIISKEKKTIIER